MDTFACELLVHITAPSSARDDRQYAAIAQSVLDFQPVTAAKLVGHNSLSQASIDTESPDDVGGQEPWPYTEGASSTWIQAHDNAHQVAKQRPEISRHRSFLPSSGSLPVQSSWNDSFNKRLHSQPVTNPRRPRTAPETGTSSFEIDVPFTGTSRRRAHSEVSSFSGSFSTVPNSHATPKNADLRVLSDGVDLTTGRELEDASRISESPASASRGPKRKKRRVDGNVTVIGDGNPFVTVRQTNSTSAHRAKTPSRSTSPRKSCSQTDNRSTSSTLSPSQPLRLGHATPRKEANASSHSRPIPTIDLTTPGRDREGFGPNQTPQASIPLDGSCEIAESDDRHTDDAHFHSHGYSIRQLVDEINGPDPPGGQQRYTTHITKTFEILSERIPLAKVFRPVHVVRNVRALERGYWLFSVRIGTETAVLESRKTPSKEERLRRLREELEAGTLHERLEKFDEMRQIQKQRSRIIKDNSPQWTEEEFITFWQNIGQFIREGKAGWGTRLVKEAQGGGAWKITMFCWGEVVGHAWLALWILSDKLTGRLPMEWRSGDGTVVVKMSGGKHRSGGLSPWVRKGEGERGVWGIGQG